ncbi:hypothetical protein [Plantactinospora endophytica]|uniref:Uncharacterized protein n=1 Tax=Plantactinospora endophytica TaxID=673535 RepID=A0ABQ4DSJ5_9ACTN|nr:hypothetical protein [Plantactinospora endophytica]GIG85418.1 hypothetical protein Pen02_03540 [Plantactinospora endophytica]
MRSAFLRATTATLLLVSAVLLPASQAGATTAGPYVDISPPAVVGAGLNPTDLPVQVVNTGGTAHFSMRLRLTVTPVAGSALRPLAATLVLTYQFGSQYRQLGYESRGDTLVATTPDLSGVDADGTATVRLQVSTRPTSSAPHVDDVTVQVTTEALDDHGTTFAADPEPDRMTMVEPRAELTGWPAQLPVGTPAVVTMTLTNTTPLPYLLLRPALAMYRSGNDQVTVERLDGGQWTPVSGPSSSYYWWYADGYPSLQPGQTYTATLRVTFTDESAAGEQSTVHHLGYTYFGVPVTVASQPYTIVARD